MTTKIKIIIAFVVATLALTAIIPLGSYFKYDYRRGETWNYGDLTAPFDFLVLKSSAEQEADIKRFNETFIPIHKKDTSLNEEMFLSMEKTLHVPVSDSLKRVNVKKAIEARLDEMYDAGIVADTSNFSSDGLIRVIDGDKMTTLSKTNLYTVNEAKAELEKLYVELTPKHAGRVMFDRYVIPNISFDEKLSLTAMEDGRNQISASKGFVPKGTTIITKGEIVEGYAADMLDSFRSEYMRSHKHGSYLKGFVDNLLYISLIMALSFGFIFFFRNDVSLNFRYILFLLFIYLMMTVLTVAVSNIPWMSVYIVPFAVVPFYIITFYDLRMSVFEYVSVLLVCSIATESPFDTFFINFLAGIVGIFVLQNAYHRARIFIATAAVLATYLLSFLAVSLAGEQELEAIEWLNMLWFLINVILLLALYQLIYLFEKIFGFVTNITLLELCDTNQALLRELAEKAPGTFQHSLQVAALAEEGVKAVGGDPLLARTGALYHDIGKSMNPAYFTENKNSDNDSPHDKLEPEISAQIIKQHVTDGYKLAKKNNLPGKIIDFIMTHHGDSLIYFFYHKYKEMHGEVDERIFRYPGPRPISKETSVCMMADAVEAASRSLKNYDEQSVSDLIDKIIDIQIADKQFSQSMLSIHDINKVKEVFKNRLTNMYHKRVAYPERD